MTTKTHTYTEEKLVTEEHEAEVTYCNGCGFPVADGEAIPLFHGANVEFDEHIHLHAWCYQTMIRPPDGGYYEIERHADWEAFEAARTRANEAAEREANWLPDRYPIPGTVFARDVGDLMRAMALSMVEACWRHTPITLALGAFAVAVWLVATTPFGELWSTVGYVVALVVSLGALHWDDVP